MLVRGKHKTTFTPHVNCGDHVIVINADKVRLTGSKMADKEYQRYSMYPGGQTRERAVNLMAASRKPWWRSPYAACSQEPLGPSPVQ
jgi:ribosomal protein L13